MYKDCSVVSTCCSKKKLSQEEINERNNTTAASGFEMSFALMFLALLDPLPVLFRDIMKTIRLCEE